jgi:hypothetical protein
VHPAPLPRVSLPIYGVADDEQTTWRVETDEQDRQIGRWLCRLFDSALSCREPRWRRAAGRAGDGASLEDLRRTAYGGGVSTTRVSQ